MTAPKTITPYVVGFILSLFFTLVAYTCVVEHVYTGSILIWVIVFLAIAQFYTQVICFLHLGRGKSAALKLWSFAATLLIIAIFVGGSLWIMSNLNYHMTPADINKYLKDQSSF